MGLNQLTVEIYSTDSNFDSKVTIVETKNKVDVPHYEVNLPHYEVDNTDYEVNVPHHEVNNTDYEVDIPHYEINNTDYEVDDIGDYEDYNSYIHQ